MGDIMVSVHLRLSQSPYLFLRHWQFLFLIYFSYDPGELLAMYSKLELPIVVVRILTQDPDPSYRPVRWHW